MLESTYIRKEFKYLRYITVTIIGKYSHHFLHSSKLKCRFLKCDTLNLKAILYYLLVRKQNLSKMKTSGTLKFICACMSIACAIWMFERSIQHYHRVITIKFHFDSRSVKTVTQFINNFLALTLTDINKRSRFDQHIFPTAVVNSCGGFNRKNAMIENAKELFRLRRGMRIDHLPPSNLFAVHVDGMRCNAHKL